MKTCNFLNVSFDVGGGFIVDIQQVGDVFNAWLWERNYGIKTIMFGMSSNEVTFREFIDLVEAALDNEPYIQDYIDEYMADDLALQELNNQ